MSVPVRYYCPRCETIVTLERSATLADQSVTPYPLEGWTYAAVGGDYEAADGVRIVCGEGETDGEGCGEPFYLNFVRFEDGRAVEPEPAPERIELASDRPRGPRGPKDPTGRAEGATRSRSAVDWPSNSRKRGPRVPDAPRVAACSHHRRHRITFARGSDRTRRTRGRRPRRRTLP